MYQQARRDADAGGRRGLAAPGRCVLLLYRPISTPNPSHPPRTPTLSISGVPRLTVEQGPGELLFVPSGWHHQVENLTGCLSLNHNWFNGSALPRVGAFLKAEAAAVRARLAHLEGTFDGEGAGWARQCEAVLQANAAMGLTDWAGLLVRKARRLVGDVGGGGGEGGDVITTHRRQQRRRDVGRVAAALKELRYDPCLLKSLFPPHLEARLRLELGLDEEDEDVWPPPPPLPQEALWPLVEEWLDGAIAACESWDGGKGEGDVVM